MSPKRVGRDVGAYLDRIGYGGSTEPNLESLAALQLAHLQSVPFEALDVFAARPVRADDDWAWNKIVGRRRGGWCFEANGAFAVLLEALGYRVRRLGAAVLLAGPATLIDHLVLEVELDQPYLVEVGFGDQAPVTPLPLNDRGPVESIVGTFEFMASSQGTTLVEHAGGAPEARYRFKRVDHRLAEFTAASDRLQADRTMHWATAPFATRLIDDAGTRITLTRRGFKTTTPTSADSGEARVERVGVEPEDWNQMLADHFGVAETFTPEQLLRDTAS